MKKLTVARQRSTRALADMQIYGIQTTRHYYREILRHPEFRSGSFNTGFVEAHPELTQYSTKRRPEFLAAAIAAAIAAQSGM